MRSRQHTNQCAPYGSAVRYCGNLSLHAPDHKPSHNPYSPDVVLERIRYFEERFHVADDIASVTGQLIKLMRNYKIGGKQVHDANIVATTQAYDIPYLLTHNVKDFQRFGELIMIEEIG